MPRSARRLASFDPAPIPPGVSLPDLRADCPRAVVWPGGRPDRAPQWSRRRHRRPVRPGRLGRAGRGRPPASSGVPRVEPADPDAGRGGAAPPDVRHLDAAFQGMAASRAAQIQSQGFRRRPVRDALRNLRPDPRRRRDRVDCGRSTMRPASRAAPNRSPGITAARSVAISAAGRSTVSHRSTRTTWPEP